MVTAMSDATRLDMPLGEAIYSLRAIRRHKPDPIPVEDLRLVIEAATQAPNGGNLQPWHFLVVTDPEMREKFAPLYHEAWWAKRHDIGIFTPEELPEAYKGAMRLAEEIGNSPAVVFVCARSKDEAAAQSIIPSVQNLLLAARALGIGGTITTLHPKVEERVHELFAIPDTARIVYCIPLGYPKGNFGPVTRKPLDKVSSMDRWGQTWP